MFVKRLKDCLPTQFNEGFQEQPAVRVAAQERKKLLKWGRRP